MKHWFGNLFNNIVDVWNKSNLAKLTNIDFWKNVHSLEEFVNAKLTHHSAKIKLYYVISKVDNIISSSAPLS